MQEQPDEMVTTRGRSAYEDMFGGGPNSAMIPGNPVTDYSGVVVRKSDIEAEWPRAGLILRIMRPLTELQESLRWHRMDKPASDCGREKARKRVSSNALRG